MKSSILLIIIVAVSCTSCYHVYYAPNTAHSPLLSEKGEVRMNAYYSGGGNSEFEGGEVQIATAVTRHVGVMMNSMFVGKTQTVSDYDGSNSHSESGTGSYIEFAGGIFKGLDDKQQWIGEVYSGFGFGTANNSYESVQRSKVGITKFFVQPAIGFKSNYFEVSVVPKISLVNWKVKRDNISNQNSYSELDDLNKIRQHPNFVCLEPALIIRAGGKGFKVHGGLSFSRLNGDLYPVENLTGSIGFSINLKPKKK